MLKLERAVILSGPFTVEADFSVAEGARVAVMGPSGAGKSTLLEGIAGFRPLRQGRIAWRGADITALVPGKRPVAMLFQDGNLFAHLTIANNVGLGIRPDLRLDRAARARVDAALERVGLAGLGARRPAELSGGQQSRAALARVLVQDRPVLLLDEPFAALGPALKRAMLDLVADLCAEKGTTLLMVSHDPADARRLTPQTIVVDAGIAAPPQPTAELLANPPAMLQDYLGREI
ncbi:thiamine ABC transporter ATP-binding protein [Pontibaca methylaminivorans]|uniref:Thiamine transport system ATP-binding protein n=1 Tax=Pontibaca methylaminivorans TaxID=515897 RepID=A0A1R3WFF2_9RHOB|nr:ATP-binding cassette domain-containing protein [Pontibaca methylaminivorans]SIT76921.1 thiamine transport system ATP-binding protein [Pontibaca methylaminivorans]